MGKRSGMEKIHKDKYPTPYDAVIPLLPFLEPQSRFVEPCANDGRLIKHLQRHGHVCIGAMDIEPRHPQVKQGDALRHRWNTPMFITNFPWSRPILHRLIEHLAAQAPVWTIIDADWAYTGQASEYLAYCKAIVSIGRVNWIEESDTTGKDNSAWYLFDRRNPGPSIEFHGPDSQFLRARRNAAGGSPHGSKS